jgi:hypothetical protein
VVNTMSRVGRSIDSILVTHLEAAELSIMPLKKCNKYNYYLQNKALNAKAFNLPRSQLSKFWQCTTPHKVASINIFISSAQIIVLEVELSTCVYLDQEELLMKMNMLPIMINHYHWKKN